MDIYSSYVSPSSPIITALQLSRSYNYTIDSSCRWNLPRPFCDKLLGMLASSSGSGDDDGCSLDKRTMLSSGDFFLSSRSGVRRGGADCFFSSQSGVWCTGADARFDCTSSCSADGSCSGLSSATSSNVCWRWLPGRALARCGRNLGTYTVDGPANQDIVLLQTISSQHWLYCCWQHLVWSLG